MKKIGINAQYHLSPLTESDIPKLIEYCNDVEIYNNTLLIPYPYLEKDAIAFLKWIDEKQKDYKLPIVYAIRQRDNALIGIIGVLCKYSNISHKEEIGYWMGKPFRGKGITTLTVKTYTDYLFSHTDYIRLEAQTYLHNTASQKVLENSGFELEGILRKNFLKKGDYLDTRMYSKIKDL